MSPRQPAPAPLLPLLAVALWCGCGGEPDAPTACPPDTVAFAGGCVDWDTRYEPEEPVDTDNVVDFGYVPQLELPPPPKSGFRLVVPPFELAPGEERTRCVSWPFPGITHTAVYTARVYTTPGLHHSNVFSNFASDDLGPNPYPACHPGASDPFAQIGQGVPDVLFANSTQVVGVETLGFPDGMAYGVDSDKEIVADVHVFNTTPEPLVVEVVYDFYTMPDEALVERLWPFVLDNRVIDVPPQATETVSAECEILDGQVVSLMPHTHDFSERFEVALLDDAGASETIYLEEGYDLESDIAMFDPPRSLAAPTKMRFGCTYHNTKDTQLVYGLGEQEMCILFGYLFPREEQFAAVKLEADSDCITIPLGK